MKDVRIDRIEIRIKGSSVTTAQELARSLGPQLLNALAATRQDLRPGIIRAISAGPAQTTGAVAERIAKEIARP